MSQIRPPVTFVHNGTGSYEMVNYPLYPGPSVSSKVEFGSNYYSDTVAVKSVNRKTQLSEGTPWRPVGPYERYSTSLARIPGNATWVFKAGTPQPGTPQQTINGQSDQPFPNVYDDPVWEPAGFPKAPSSNTKIRGGDEVMLKVASKKTSYGDQLAQLHHDVRDVLGTITELAHAGLAIKHGKFGAAAKALGLNKRDLLSGKNLAQRWLQLQYGFIPMAQDVHDSIKLLQEGFRKVTPLMHSTRDIKDAGSFTTVPGLGPGGVDVKWSSVFRTKVWYSFEPSFLAHLSEMGLINPLEVAWEVTPYSFVVDWFMPVGNFLEALTARVGVTFIDGYTGWKVESTYTSSPSYGDSYYGRFTGTSQKLVRTNRGYTRSKLTGFPVPGLYFKSPFSSKHALNALALVRQLIR